MVLSSATGSNDVDVVAIQEGKPAVPGGVSLTDVDGFVVGEVAGVAGVVAQHGNVNLTATGGDMTISRSVDCPSVAVYIAVTGQERMLSVSSGGRISSASPGAFNTLRADKMQLDGTIEASSGLVALLPHNAGKAINLGSTTDTIANTLELSDAELDRITAGVIRIGSSTAGNITVVGPGISLAGADTLHWTTGGTVTQSAGVTVANLAVEAQGDITLATNVNEFSTVAASSVTGNVSFNDSSGYAVGTVDGIQGVRTGGQAILTAQSGNLTIRNTAAGDDVAATIVIVTLYGNDALLETESGARLVAAGSSSSLYLNADKMRLAGTISGQYVYLRPMQNGDWVNLGSTTDSAPNTLELSDAELNGITATRNLQIGEWSGGVTVSAPVGAEGANMLWLKSNGGVTQTAAILQPWLWVQAAGSVVLNGQNEVDTLVLTTTAGDISFTDVDGFIATRTDGQPAIKAANGSVTLSVGRVVTWRWRCPASWPLVRSTFSWKGTMPSSR